MANQIAVSFEDEFVRVVYASASSRGAIAVQKTLLLKDEEFDNFLAREKSRSFIVVVDFKVFYCDILYLPPAKEKYLRRLVDAEIRKRIPLKEFTFFYTVLGETFREGRKSKEVFFYAVSNADLFRILERFDNCKKVVKCIYPAALALARLVNAVSPGKDELQLCIVESGPNKVSFLTKNGKPYFIRNAQSLEAGIHDIDVHDINMTINYCRQTLRMIPSLVLLLGGVCRSYDTAMSFAVPAACMYFPEHFRPDPEDSADFIIPIAALLPDRSPDPITMLPRQYALPMLQKKVFAFCTAFFILVSLIGLGYLKDRVSEIFRLKGEAEALRAQIRLMDSNRRSYEQHNRELKKYMPLIDYINTVYTTPDVQKALISLSSLKEPHETVLQLNALSISAETRALKLQLKGEIKAERYADIQRHYRILINELRSLGGISLASDSLDLKSKSFQIEAYYRDK